MPSAGDVVVIDFPGVQGIKRRPAVVLSSAVYHTSRPDVVVGLITSRAVAAGPTDHTHLGGTGGPGLHRRMLALAAFWARGETLVAT